MQPDISTTVQPPEAEFKQTTNRIPLDLWKRWAHASTDEQTSMTAILIEALELWLSGKSAV